MKYSEPAAWKKWRELFPDMQATDGVINLDCEAYPYQDKVTLYVGLTDEDINGKSENELEALLFKETILKPSHQCPNYLMLMRKVGRKLCKTGYPVYGPIETLMQKKNLLVKLGLGDRYVWMVFPVELHLDCESPLADIELYVRGFASWDAIVPTAPPEGKEDLGITIMTIGASREPGQPDKEKDRLVYRPESYHFGKNDFAIDKFSIPMKEVSATQNRIYVYEPALQVYPLSR